MSIRDMRMLGIGEPNDVGGTETEGTVNAKLNTVIRQTGKIYAHLFGEYVNNFGDGRMGDFVYGETPDSPQTDAYFRRVYYTESFTIPAGKTMKVTEKNCGMIVFARGDITIDGTLDISVMRRSADPEGLPQSISLLGVEYMLAEGGASGNNAKGNCGEPGTISSASGTHTHTDSGSGLGAITPKSVSGGAFSGYRYIEPGNSSYPSTNSNCGRLVSGVAAGALVLIAAGTITINGTIYAQGPTASYNKNGQAPKLSGSTVYAGRGGDALTGCGGGGAVTMIAKSVVKNGTVNVSGREGSYISAGIDGSGTQTDGRYTATAGKGAKGYTCGAGLAGNIKEYLLTGG